LDVTVQAHIALPTVQALRQGREAGHALAQAIRAKLTVIHVVPEFPDGVAEGTCWRVGGAEKPLRADAARRSKAILAAVRSAARAAGVTCNIVTATSGRPYDAIVKHAKKARCD